MAQLKTGKFIAKKRKELNLSIRWSNSVRFYNAFFRRYCVKKSRYAATLRDFFSYTTKTWHFKTAKHQKSFSFRIIGCFFYAVILSYCKEKNARGGRK